MSHLSIDIDITCEDCGERIYDASLTDRQDLFALEDALKDFRLSVEAYGKILCSACQEKADGENYNEGPDYRHEDDTDSF